MILNSNHVFIRSKYIKKNKITFKKITMINLVTLYFFLNSAYNNEYL